MLQVIDCLCIWNGGNNRFLNVSEHSEGSSTSTGVGKLHWATPQPDASGFEYGLHRHTVPFSHNLSQGQVEEQSFCVGFSSPGVAVLFHSTDSTANRSMGVAVADG